MEDLLYNNNNITQDSILDLDSLGESLSRYGDQSFLMLNNNDDEDVLPEEEIRQLLYLSSVAASQQQQQLLQRQQQRLLQQQQNQEDDISGSVRNLAGTTGTNTATGVATATPPATSATHHHTGAPTHHHHLVDDPLLTGVGGGAMGNANAGEHHEDPWNPVREWLATHTPHDIQMAAEVRNDPHQTTALHLAARSHVMDIVELLLSVAPQTASWADSFGWLPLHYACVATIPQSTSASSHNSNNNNNKNSQLVIQALVESFPEGKTAVDSRGRTPLHFALGSGTGETAALPGTIHILASSGAAAVKDEIGMLVRTTGSLLLLYI